MTVVSSSALATLTVPKKQDVLVQLIAHTASELQLKVKKGNALELKLFNGTVLQERNSILRSLCGSGLLYALDESPLYLLGGHSVNVLASPSAAMALAGITSCMSVADSVKRGKEESSFLESLNTHLTTRAFLINSSHSTLADMDLALSIIESKLEVNEYPNITRWIHQVHADMLKLAGDAVVIPPLTLSSEPPQPVPVFYYGLEDFVPASTTSTIKKSPKKSASGDNKATKDDNNKADKPADKKKAKKEVKQPQPPAAEVDISALDIRVGKIVKAWHHEEADKLFCEEIDVAEAEPRKICSGLRDFYKQEELENRLVLVLCNLKSRNMKGFPSHGMVLCGSNKEHTEVQFVVPPAEAKIGERVSFEGVEMKSPEPENKIQKKKILEKVLPDLKTNNDGEVVWNTHTATTSAGKVTCGMANAHVS